MEVDEQLNQRLSAATGTTGAFVLRVQPGGSADKAGLTGVRVNPEGVTPGDVVTAVEGKTVETAARLLARLDHFKVGDVVHLTVRRGQQTRDVAVTLQPGT